MSRTLPKPMSLPVSEWFIPFHKDSATNAGKEMTFTASPAQCVAVAKRLDVVAVENLSGTVTATLQNAGHIVYLSGYVQADITQECIKTLRPVNSHIHEPFEAWYADLDKVVSFTRAKQSIKAMEEGDEVQMLDEKDDPEPLVNSQVDIGEVMIQFLSLAINPYPRADDNEEESKDDVGCDEDNAAKNGAHQVRPNPFSALKNWRPKD